MLLPRSHRAAALALLALLLSLTAPAAETPSSYGEPAKVDNPILRIPYMRKAPEIDGVLAPGEWEDAGALSCFWYDYTQADFRFMAPMQTQLQVYGAFDKEFLYLAYSSPVYPENSWLKARARFPDVIGHPLYGLQWDDHLELELRPFADLAKGFQLGLFKWFINPINTYSDQYWTINQGEGKSWKSQMKARSQSTGKRWVVELAIPYTAFVTGNYDAKDATGRPLVPLPPADGTVYRSWFTRAIGGNGDFFIAYDAHIWNTTKNQLVFDSQAPSFQVNELGPIMEDVIDLSVTVKNHADKSQTVRLGFFVESAEGLIYSSYAAPELKEGLLELVPGEVKKLRLRQPYPGISTDGNVLWFDVRAAGNPAKILYRTRLVRFHSMDGGVLKDIPFRQRRVECITALRPPRKDFDFRWDFSSYTKRISAVVDLGIHGASEEAKSAKEAKLSVLKNNADEDVLLEKTAPVNGDFATFLFDVPKLTDGESYKLSLLLFDANKRIVGEENGEPFKYKIEPWMNTKTGTDDVVWEPFTAMQATATGFSTLKHEVTVSDAGLPAQLIIKPDARDLPLERRAAPAMVTPAELEAAGRGPQLRAPMRLEVIVGGQRLPAQATAKAKLVRTWKSELEYQAQLQIGPVPAMLTVRYDCDGSLHGRLVYGGPTAAQVDALELVTDLSGPVDMAFSASDGGGMAAADVWDCGLPEKPGVVWDLAKMEPLELFYSRFTPWFWLGSGDRGFSWFSVSDQGWLLDRAGTSMIVERDAAGKVTWRVKFVNHPVAVQGEHEVTWSLLVHPAKPKPAKYRLHAWQYRSGWSEGYAVEAMDLSDQYLKDRWRHAASAPKDLPYEKANTWRKDDPPWNRYGRWRNIGTCPELDQIWQDKGSFHYERHIRIGRRMGGWMDEYWPEMHPSNNLAMGNAYLRRPEDVGPNEIPWQRQWLTDYQRGFYKRIGREYARNNVPNRNCTWANNASTFLESFLYDGMLVEECGAGHRAYEVDMVTQFPNTLYRYMAHNFTGLVMRAMADVTPVGPGDDKRLDRQLLGRALLNDIGVCYDGPHGVITHKEQGVRLLSLLTDFGYFEADGTEYLPYWRSGGAVRYGSGEPDTAKVYVSVWRRALPNGRGTKALILLFNENFTPTTLPLTLMDPKRVLGGPNTLNAGQVLGGAGAGLTADLQQWWQALAGRDAQAKVLRDAETGEIIPRLPGAAEAYGPLLVPYHDYRLLYAEAAQ